MDLGKALVEELGLDQSVDTLSRWMAHHIAELIESVETAKAEDRQVKTNECANAILNLWEHRHLLPNGKRPFGDMQPILRALESLDPTDDTPRYFRSLRTTVDETELNTETRKWFELADGIDYSAKILIRYCLTQAAQTTLDRAKEWVALAEAVGFDDGVEFPAIHTITDEDNLLKTSEPDDKKQTILENRIKRLESFKIMSDALTSDLRRQLMKDRVSK